MKKLEQILLEMETTIPEMETQNSLVSGATIGWQIAHSLKTIDQIILACQQSNPADYRWNFNFNRFLILTLLRKIPRGKAKAPRVVQPEGEITEASLKASLVQVRKHLNEWESLPENAFFKHPFFGNLNKKATLAFLILHTNHHWKVIADILKKEK